MSENMRVSEGFVCLNQEETSVHRLQLTLTDTVNGATKKLSQFGETDETSQCYAFKVNTDNDFLRTVRFIYNDEGLKGI